MKNEICIEAQQMSELDLTTTLTDLKASLKAPVEWLRQYYSHVIGHEISMRQVLLLINAQVALLAVVGAWALPVFVQLLSAGWFGGSVWACKRSLHSGY